MAELSCKSVTPCGEGGCVAFPESRHPKTGNVYRKNCSTNLRTHERKSSLMESSAASAISAGVTTQPSRSLTHTRATKSILNLNRYQTNAILASERYARAEDAQQVARRLPLNLLNFDELLDDALKAMGKLLDDPKTSALTKLRIIEEIFDRDPTGALAKRTQPVTPANQPSPVFDNEAIRKLKERAAGLVRANRNADPCD
jgi:hypothetical protein